MASFAAVVASDKPITIMIGPTTIGGKTLLTQPEPTLAMIKATIT
mgnify:CR=1 FL=1